MTTHVPRENWAYRLGSAAGRAWRGYVRREQGIIGWLIMREVPAGIAAVLLWIAKLVALGVLLYVAFWLALLFVFAVVAAWAVQHGALDSHGEGEQFTFQDELSRLRQTSGYDPNLYNDTSHEMYKDN